VYLGFFYEHGVEYKRDLPRAYAYYNFAARNGHQDAELMRKKLAKKISPAEAERARDIRQELEEITAGLIPGFNKEVQRPLRQPSG
jgi:TPR repeat protein